MPQTLPELRINGSDVVYQTYGVRMGDGFIDALTEPLSLKDFIENESRLEHGTRVVVGASPKCQARELTLDFTIEGSSPADFLAKKNAFLSLMYAGSVEIQVPRESPDTYRLVYLGKGATYSVNPQRTFCHIVLKFKEPNPADRAESATSGGNG